MTICPGYKHWFFYADLWKHEAGKANKRIANGSRLGYNGNAVNATVTEDSKKVTVKIGGMTIEGINAGGKTVVGLNDIAGALGGRVVYTQGAKFMRVTINGKTFEYETNGNRDANHTIP